MSRPEHVHDYVGHSGRLYTGVTGLGCLFLPADRQPRKAIIDLLESPPVELFLLSIIIANCVTLAMDAPGGVDPGTAANLAQLNRVFLYIYTVEAFFKMVAYGLHDDLGSYLTDGWALFELFIVVVSWLPILFDLSGGQALSVVRAFRALRVLLALTHIPGMQSLVTAALGCLPALSSVLALCALLIAMAGILGVQFLKGCLRFRCADPAVMTAGLDVQAHFDTGELCGASRTSCADGMVCFRFAANSEDGGGASFDSFGESFVPVISTFLLDGWGEMMLAIMRGYSPYAWIFFVFLAIAGGFLMLQLFLAVVSETFTKNENARKKAEAADETSGRADGDGAEAPPPKGEGVRTGEEETRTLIPSTAPPSHQPGSMGSITAMVNAPWFGNLAVGLVVFNVCVMSMPYQDEPAEWTLLRESLSTLLTWAFIVEMGLKLVGLGCRAYWSNGWNALDGSLVLLSVAEMTLLTIFQGAATADAGQPGGMSQMLRMLRILRLLRAIRAMRAWTGMYRIILAFLTSLPQIANLLLLTLAIMYLFAIVGMALYGASGLSEVSREHFDSFPVAMLTVLGLFNGNLVDSIIMSIDIVGRPLTAIYYGAAILIGFLGIMNLFVAVLLEAFGGDAEGETDEDEEATPDAPAPAPKPAPVDALQLDLAFSQQGVSDLSQEPPLKKRAAPIGAEAHIASLERRLYELETENQKLHAVTSAPLCCGGDDGSQPLMRRAAQAVANSMALEYLIITLISLSSLCLVLDHPTLDPSSKLSHYLALANYCFTAIFTLEALIKVYAHGAHEYFASAWNLVDSMIVTTSLLALLSDAIPQFAMMKSLRILRVLRPLRLLVRNRGMKVVVDALIETLPAVLNISGIVLGLQVVFAIVGMKLFMGSFGSCTNPTYTTRAACEAAAAAAAGSQDASHRLLRGGGGGSSGRSHNTDTIAWLNPRAGNFDDFAQSMLALFIMSTGDNMPDLMYAGMDAVGIGEAPVRTDWSPSALFFIAWTLVGAFIAINLFIGAIVDSFCEIRAQSDGMVMMTPAQKQWTILMRESRDLVPTVTPRPPHRFFVSSRTPLYNMVIKGERGFDDALLIVILANVAVLACDYEGIEAGDAAFYAWWLTANDFFNLIYFIEFGIKMVALGVCGYFVGLARKFEFLLICATILELYESHMLVSPMVLRALRILRVARLLRLLQGPRAAELRTLLKTLLISIPALANVASVLSLVVFIYAVLGVQLFCFVMDGAALQEHMNFRSFGSSCLVLFQVLTGDGWSALMLDTMADETMGCKPDAVPTDCGSWIALPYFISFTVVGGFVFLNLVVAVVLENFSSLSERREEDERLKEIEGVGLVGDEHIDEFIQLWAEYDPDGDRYIHRAQLEELIQRLPAPLGERPDGAPLPPAHLTKPGQIMKLGGLTRSTRVHFNDVLKQLIRASFIGGLHVESPAKILRDAKREEGSLTAREMEEGDDVGNAQPRATWQAPLMPQAERLPPPGFELNTPAAASTRGGTSAASAKMRQKSAATPAMPSSHAEFIAQGWTRDPQRPNSWIPPGAAARASRKQFSSPADDADAISDAELTRWDKSVPESMGMGFEVRPPGSRPRSARFNDGTAPGTGCSSWSMTRHNARSSAANGSKSARAGGLTVGRARTSPSMDESRLSGEMNEDARILPNGNRRWTAARRDGTWSENEPVKVLANGTEKVLAPASASSGRLPEPKPVRQPASNFRPNGALYVCKGDQVRYNSLDTSCSIVP